MVESQPSKLLVAGSIPVSRSNLRSSRSSGWQASPHENARCDEAAVATVARGKSAHVSREADVAQLAEHVLGKDEVTSSILVIGSTVIGSATAHERAGRRRQ